MFHICIIEDDPAVRVELKILLENALYRVTALAGCTQVEEQILALKPDLLLLDVQLPEKNGFLLCEEIRGKSEVPIIFLTARTGSMDELNGILKGGDDYITKPYVAPVLLARIAAVLKRVKRADQEEKHVLTCREVSLDIAAGKICFQGKQAELTKNELKILYYLMDRQGVIVSRADLIDYLWENEIFIDDNALSVNVTRIRNKLYQIGISDLIQTKRGMGYQI